MTHMHIRIIIYFIFLSVCFSMPESEGADNCDNTSMPQPPFVFLSVQGNVMRYGDIGTNMRIDRFQCTSCQQIFLDLNVIIQHCEQEHDDEFFTCDECGIIYLNELSFQAHNVQHIDETERLEQGVPYCQECGIAFPEARFLMEHILTEHVEAEP